MIKYCPHTAFCDVCECCPFHSVSDALTHCGSSACVFVYFRCMTALTTLCTRNYLTRPALCSKSSAAGFSRDCQKETQSKPKHNHTMLFQHEEFLYIHIAVIYWNWQLFTPVSKPLVYSFSYRVDLLIHVVSVWLGHGMALCLERMAMGTRKIACSDWIKCVLTSFKPFLL